MGRSARFGVWIGAVVAGVALGLAAGARAEVQRLEVVGAAPAGAG